MPADSAYKIRQIDGIAAIDKAKWQACDPEDNPFVGYDFLSALERSGTIGPGTGWQAQPLLIEDMSGRILAAAPLYRKTHSFGEYVFDQAWAVAYERAGGDYYPKYQVASPFSPVPGPRLLCAAGDERNLRDLLADALIERTEKDRLSSLHVTFCRDDEAALLAEHGFLRRLGWQYHWHNAGYRDFADFLDSLAARKRKAIRKERAAIADQSIAIEILSGADIRPAHWDAMFAFYSDTGSRKWGQPYLNRAFFQELGKNFSDRSLLVLAARDDRYLAGALHILGRDALYGRYWGCLEDFRFLHFECCYYRAIEYAIAHGLARVEAGAQGEHKIQRGYLPVATHSAHWIADPGLRAAIADFLERERSLVESESAALGELSPFRRSL